MESNYYFGIFSWIFLFSTFAGLGMFLLLRRHWRSTPSTKYLAFLCVAVAEWAFAYVFETAALTVVGKLFWAQISYVGATTAPVLLFAYSVTEADAERFFKPAYRLLVCIVPAVTLLLAFTNMRHRLVWTDIDFIPGSYIALYSHGAWYWVFIVYSYLLIFVGLLAYFLSIAGLPKYYRNRAFLIFFSLLLPFVGNAMYVLERNPLPGMDWTPIFFSLSCGIASFAVLRFRIFDLVPVARNLLVETMGDGVLVLDSRGVILDINPPMKTILPGIDESAIGRVAKTALDRWPMILEALNEGTFEVTGEGGTAYYDVERTALCLSKGTEYGGLFVFRDITARKKLELEREKLVGELKEAAAQVKTLSGLLPICSSCKKIRDDRGYWQGVENYIASHSEVVFTHGICPDCMKKLEETYKHRV